MSAGISLWKKGLYDEAGEMFYQETLINPNNFDAHLSMGVMAFMLNDYEIALSGCEKSLLIKPDYTEAKYWRALSLYELGMEKIACIHLKSLTSLYPLALDAWNKCQCYDFSNRK